MYSVLLSDFLKPHLYNFLYLICPLYTFLCPSVRTLCTTICYCSHYIFKHTKHTIVICPVSNCHPSFSHSLIYVFILHFSLTSFLSNLSPTNICLPFLLTFILPYSNLQLISLPFNILLDMLPSTSYFEQHNDLTLQMSSSPFNKSIPNFSSY